MDMNYNLVIDILNAFLIAAKVALVSLSIYMGFEVATHFYPNINFDIVPLLLVLTVSAIAIAGLFSRVYANIKPKPRYKGSRRMKMFAKPKKKAKRKSRLAKRREDDALVSFFHEIYLEKINYQENLKPSW